MKKILLSLLLALPVVAAVGQTPEDEVVGVIETFFEGFAAQDSTVMRSVSDADGRLVITTSDESGNPVVRPIPMTEFVRLISRREGPPIVETWWNPDVFIHDNLATVWLDYNLWVGDRIDHCGKDTFQLARTADGWTIIAIADTQRREGCEDRGLRE